MAGGFSETVNPPGAASYSAPLLNFAQFGQWANDFQQGQLNSQQRTTNDQTQQLNQQKIQQGQRQQEIDTLFSGGLPKDAQGNIDYQKVAAMLAQKGDIGALTQLSPLIQQSQAANTPELPGPQGGAPQGGGAQPSSVQARPLPAPAANSPKGDPGQGTLVDVVTDKLPSQNLTTGETITKIAQVMGVDPNATLTPGQLVRAQGLLKKYAPDIAGSGGGGSPLPPSANAGSPAPKITPQQPPQAPPVAQTGAPQPQVQPQPQPQPQPVAAQPQQPRPPVAAQPQAPQGGPITPQVPLPPGYTDPQEAILALNRRAAQLEAANPKMKPKADDLRDWATRIEKSIQPVQLHAGTTIVDPASGRTIVQGQSNNLKDIPLRRFLDEHPEATAEDIQKFVAQGHPARSVATISLQKFLEEHPDASAEDIQNFNAAQVGKSTTEKTKASIDAANGSVGNSPTLDADAESYRQTGKLPPGMGRGIQGAAEAKAIRQRAVDQEIAEGGDPADWASRWQNFSTQATGKRVLEQRAAGLSLAENEASSLIPRVREISGKVPRTNYPNINSLILAAQKGTGGQDVIKLGIAIESLVPVYARVLKPVGQVGQGDMARAHDILDKAWSDGQIGAALDQMQVELKSARTALDKTMSESETRGRKKKEDDTGKGTDKGADPDGWVTAPNGARIREVK